MRPLEEELWAGLAQCFTPRPNVPVYTTVTMVQDLGIRKILAQVRWAVLSKEARG